MTSDYGKLHRS